MLPPPQTLARAAAANFAVHAGWVQHRVMGMSVRRREGLTIVDSGTACDTFNLVLGAQLSRAAAHDAIRSAVESFAGRPFSWWVAPGDEPRDLGALLTAEGLAPAETELAMALSLDSLVLPDAAPPAELRVERASTQRAIGEFARINAANWSPPDSHVIDFYHRATPVLLSPACPLRFYVGYAGGTAVATAEATVEGDVVGLYNIATLTSHRRRGLGSALTLAPLLEARRGGCRLAILQAAPDGVGVYRRLGFTEFGTITEYKRP